MAERFPPELLKGTTDLVVLAVLARERLHGYALIQRLRESSGDRFRINEGSLYPLLHRLERAKWLRAREQEAGGRVRKSYETTAAGRKELARRTREWEAFRDAVQDLVAPPPDGTERPSVNRERSPR